MNAHDRLGAQERFHAAYREAVTFESYWAFFVSLHLHRRTRSAHRVGDNLTTLGVLAALARRSRPLGVTFLVLGQGLAIASHFIWEKTPPVDFVRVSRHPLWFMRADLTRAALQASGRFDREVDRFLDELPLRLPDRTTSKVRGQHGMVA